MKHLKLKALALGLVMLGVWSCENEKSTEEHQLNELSKGEIIQVEDNFSEENFFDYQSNEQLGSLADLELSNGNTLHFYGEESVDSGILVLENGTCSACSALTDLENLTKKELSPVEIYWALSKPGTVIPALIQEKGGVKILNKVQGWARNQINKVAINKEEATKAADLACNNASFTSTITGGFNGNPDYVRLDKTPNTYSSFRNDCYNPAANGECWGAPRYKLAAQFSNIRSWRGKVCTRNVERSYNTHWIRWCGSSCSVDPRCNANVSCNRYQGPVVMFEYYWNGKWHLMKSGSKIAAYEIPANKTYTYNWRWYTSQNTSFRLNVRYAKGYDQFDLMMDK